MRRVSDVNAELLAIRSRKLDRGIEETVAAVVVPLPERIVTVIKTPEQALRLAEDIQSLERAMCELGRIDYDDNFDNYRTAMTHLNILLDRARERLKNEHLIF